MQKLFGMVGNQLLSWHLTFFSEFISRIDQKAKRTKYTSYRRDIYVWKLVNIHRLLIFNSSLFVFSQSYLYLDISFSHDLYTHRNGFWDYIYKASRIYIHISIDNVENILFLIPTIQGHSPILNLFLNSFKHQLSDLNTNTLMMPSGRPLEYEYLVFL